MNKILLLVCILISNRLLAIDRFVDPTISSGNGTTIFKTINLALSAAQNGDRILILPGTYNETTLNLDKTLTLLAQTPGTVINLNANIVITGFPGMKLEILGFNLGAYSISANGITNGTANNRAKVSIIDCKMTNLYMGQSYYELNCMSSTITSGIDFKFGNFITSRTSTLNISDEPNSNLNNSKILIAADTIDGLTSIIHDDYPLTIANCRLNSIYWTMWNTNNSITNYIRNNEFISGTSITISPNPPLYNIEFSSNEFLAQPSFYTGSNCWNVGVGNWTSGYNGGCINLNNSSSSFPNPSVSGFFNWTYNGIDLPSSPPNASQPLVLNKITGTTGTNINSGNPAHNYYDIDLTINDRGRNGGPYSIKNYVPSINPSNGKAFIFDLEIPSNIYTGQQIDIKAKGYHKN